MAFQLIPVHLCAYANHFFNSCEVIILMKIIYDIFSTQEVIDFGSEVISGSEYTHLGTGNTYQKFSDFQQKIFV